MTIYLVGGKFVMTKKKIFRNIYFFFNVEKSVRDWCYDSCHGLVTDFLLKRNLFLNNDICLTKN